MNTQQFLVLGLILIVIMLLFRNNGRETFEGGSESNKNMMVSKPEINLEDIINELETVLCLMETCPHCQKFKNMSEEQIKDELDIPKYVKLTKVVHMGPYDKESQAVFEKFDVTSAPTLVVAHRGTGLKTSSYPSKEMIANKVKEFVPMIAQWYRRFTMAQKKDALQAL
jgi:thiol-disulfide isomerase/thioredoxin